MEMTWPDTATLHVLKHMSLPATAIGLLTLLGASATRQANGRSAKWTAEFYSNKNARPQFAEESGMSAPHQVRFSDQFTEVKGRIEHHSDVMGFFYAAYYMTIMCFSVAAAVAAVTALLVSKAGWDASNEYVINLFFTTTLLSAFFASSPAVFQVQQNITDNKVFCMKYLALRNEMLTYAVTSERLKYDGRNPLPIASGSSARDERTPLGIALSSAEFLHYIDLQLSRDNVAIGFDVKQVADFKGALEMK